ncbi:MAG: N-acetyltransferase [Ideonella sp.]|nr:N-acetyltransferase [Ideonella sp.]
MIHNRQGFECGVPALDEYLHRFAEQHRRRGICSVYVLTDSAQPAHILGIYTLSAAVVDGQSLAPAERKKLTRYPVPCFRLARLACQTDRRGLGLGKVRVGCAVDRCLKARQHVAACALLVDAKDDDAEAFCAHFGFKSMQDVPQTLYLPFGR